MNTNHIIDSWVAQLARASRSASLTTFETPPAPPDPKIGTLAAHKPAVATA